jgi:SAM-dependent methyltransferase
VVARRRPHSILEIGTGRGAVGARLAERAQYVGVEPDETSRLTAERAISACGTAAVVGSIAELPVDRRFDLVCAFEVLEHLEDDLGALVQWSTFVADSGFVLLSVPAHQRRFGATDRRVGHIRRYDRRDILDLVADAGLRVESVWSTGWPMGRALESVWNVVAERRPGTGSAVERSSESGRWFQPNDWVAPLWALAGALGVRMQRMRFHTEAGTGWVVECRRA